MTSGLIDDAINAAKPADRPGMRWIPGGTFRMGSDRHYPEEAPVHRVAVDGFWMDECPVTNRQFRRFVQATGYRTLAEIPPDPKDYPGALPHLLFAGSLVCVPPRGPIDLRHHGRWWMFLKGADRRHPYGPSSSLKGLDDHPVVHVAFEDAEAYANELVEGLQWARSKPASSTVAKSASGLSPEWAGWRQWALGRTSACGWRVNFRGPPHAVI